MKKFIFIPVVNNFQLLQTAINSVKPDLFEEYFIFNNTVDGVVPVDKKHFKIINEGRKSFMETQNIMRQYAIDNGYDYFCFMHNDGEIIGDVLERLVEMAETSSDNWGVIFTHYDVLCAFSTRAVSKTGEWGDVFWPPQASGYYLDCDYYRRIKIEFEALQVHLSEKSNVLHNSFSNTLKSPEESIRWSNESEKVRNYYIYKWGGDPGNEKYTIPKKMSLSDYLNLNGMFGFEGHSQNCNEETVFLRQRATNCKQIMEIGFNAGHSAESFLQSSPPDSSVISFDLGEHSDYIPVAKKFIDLVYPGRHTLILGDSRVTVPAFANQHNQTKFDLIFIDGGHTDDIPAKDLENCKALSHNETIVIMDDVKLINPNWYNHSPTKAWNECIENGVIKQLGQTDFSETHGIAYGKYINVEFLVSSLLSSNERVDIIKKNQKNLQIKIFKSVNGYDKKETLDELKKHGISYKFLQFKTYGTLACWITKYKILKYQIENNIEFLCFMEDDIELKEGFKNFIYKLLCSFDDKDTDILRLFDWGECYVTSLQGAKRIIKKLDEDGITHNIDNQLRDCCSLRVYGVPAALMIPTNQGDCLKTEYFDNLE